MRKLLVGVLSGLSVAGLAVQAMAQDQQFISIGTGGVTGVYYPTGGAICRLVNKDRKEHGIRCSVESTGGSVYNVNTIQAGELDFGVAQSDVQSNAYNGLAQWDGKPFEGLRAVFSVHPEPATLVTRADAGIENYTDLAGKTVNIGNPGSGQRALWDAMEEAGLVDSSELKLAAELKPAETGQALCDGRVDAYFYTVGHPSALIQETLSTCDAVIANVSGPEIEEFISDKPYYRLATLAPETYAGQDNEVSTFGVGATFVTSADVSDEVVYTLVKAVFENFDDFKKLHPAFANLKQEEMVKDGLSAPLHPGAEKYYKEQGWM
ncbi:TAXI family TRAP transporter solute-binding subunit [Mesorhizobium xinjiangense]|uniref:TAXI family TRAP transporter solute-binding subunit n=1 Tax=Mesorhizobium xinjiangense TaxID=2678685 RepID=UPI0012EE56F0|nr:TAXI family TRAP transporter solute-binding subunit [Mesorhizobium xinjiangense]